MKYSNELKVGAAIIITVIIFIVGIRYFQDIPIFRGTYQIATTFQDANGLTTGNNVRVNGVTVGKVANVVLRPEEGFVRVVMEIDSDIQVPEGSVAEVSGLSVLGTVFVTVHLGPPGNPPVPDGGSIPSRAADGGLGELTALTDRAPELINQVDSVLTGADATLASLEEQLQNPSSNLQTTLIAIRQLARSLESMLRAQEGELEQALQNVASLSSSLNTVTEENRDSIALAISNLNAALTGLNASLETLESTTTSLDAIVAKINQGEGTLGLLVNDPSLYHKLDSTATELSLLVRDLRENPRRYLRELKLVDVF